MFTGAVDPGGDLAEREARVLDEEDRQPGIRRQFGAFGVGQDRDRTTLASLGGKARAVALEALDADEQVAGMEVAGAERDAGDLEAVDRAAVVDAELLDEAGQRAGRRMFRADDRGDPGTQTRLLSCDGPATR